MHQSANINVNVNANQQQQLLGAVDPNSNIQSSIPAVPSNAIANANAITNPHPVQVQVQVQVQNNPTAIPTAIPTTPHATHAPPPSSSSLKSQPTYVNAKQYHRILQRREARRKLDIFYVKRRASQGLKKANLKREAMQALGAMGNGSGNEDDGGVNRRAYIHESRHKHAMKRPRGPGGRFLTKDELVTYYKSHPDDDPKNFKK